MPAIAQPIVTAPRDGSHIIGFDKSGWREMWFVRDQYEGEFWRDEFGSEPEPSLWVELPMSVVTQTAAPAFTDRGSGR